MIQLRLEYMYDPDVKSWDLAVPTLHIVSSAETREAAQDEAIAAIAIALDDTDGPTPVLPGVEIESLTSHCDAPHRSTRQPRATTTAAASTRARRKVTDPDVSERRRQAVAKARAVRQARRGLAAPRAEHRLTACGRGQPGLSGQRFATELVARFVGGRAAPGGGRGVRGRDRRLRGPEYEEVDQQSERA